MSDNKDRNEILDVTNVQRLDGAPSIREAFSKTRFGEKLEEVAKKVSQKAGEAIMNTPVLGNIVRAGRNWKEEVFGEGAAEQMDLKYLKTKLLNMVSKIISMLRESLVAESTEAGKKIAANKQVAKKEAAVGDTKTPVKDAGLDKAVGKDKGIGTPAAAAKETGAKAAKPLVTDVKAAIANAELAASGGAKALISGKGIDIKAPDLSK